MQKKLHMTTSKDYSEFSAPSYAEKNRKCGKTVIFQLAFLILFILSFIPLAAQSENPKYNKALADSLGADEYGMKSYVLVILKTGPSKIENKTVRDSLFRGHMETIVRLANEGKLVVSGPFEKNNKNFRGIYILNVKTVEEANKILAADPSVKAGIFDTETFLWYGSAALPLYLESHSKIEKNVN